MRARADRTPRGDTRRGTVAVGALAIASLLACGDGDRHARPDATTPDASAPDAGAPPTLEGDLFARLGPSFRFVVSPEMAARMDFEGGLGAGEDGVAPGPPPPPDVTFADELTVTMPDGASATYAPMKVWLIGNSTFREWALGPNIRVDADAFHPGLRIAGAEHLRLNNGGLYGGLFREATALAVWSALGYSTLRTTTAWVEAPNQWGDERRAMVLAEVYKRRWCDREVPGGCVNMWEGGFGEPWRFVDDPDDCQLEPCDDTRLAALAELVAATPLGPGFTAATAGHVDWDAFRSFMCLSWITGAADDYVHNSNNIVLVERADARFQFFPYSLDVSAASPWGPPPGLMGTSDLARGCQADASCWSALLERCDELLTRYEELDLTGTVIAPLIEETFAAGLAGAADQAVADEVRAFYDDRVARLRGDEVWTYQPCFEDAQCPPTEVCDVWTTRCTAAEPARAPR